MDFYNTLNKPKKNEDILEKYISQIFDKEIWVDMEVSQIAEVTYSYVIEKDGNGEEKEKGPFLNTTLFSKIGGLNEKNFFNASKLKREEMLKEAGSNFIKIVGGKIKQIEKSIKEIKSLKYDSNLGTNVENLEEEKNNVEIFEIKRELLIKSLIHNKFLLEASIIGLPFELEKAGLKHNLKEEEIESRCIKLDEIDDICFGGKFSKENNTKEIITIYEDIKTTYENNKEKINANEKEKYEKYLKILEDYLPKGYKFEPFKEPKKALLEKINNVKTHRNNYIEGFNTYISAHEMKYLAEIDTNVANITDTEKSLRFPNTKKAEFENIERILKLKAHEVDAHTSNLLNGNNLLGFRGARNIEKEEGIAKLLEHLFIYGKNAYSTLKKGEKIINLKKIKINDYNSKIFFAELLDGEEFLEFLNISEKIEKDKMIPIKRFLRLKRNRPLNKPGCQHKDTTYMRGLFETAQYINGGNDFLDLFLGKFSFKDLEKLKRIKELREQNGEEINIIEPGFIYEEIYFKLLKRFGGKKYKGLKFIDYLKEKYPFFNFGKIEIKRTRKDVRKKVLEIIKMFKGNIKKQTL